MPRKPKTKYTLRSDGRIVATKKYGDTRKSFYGHSDAEVEEKIRAYEQAEKRKSAHLFEDLADIYWEEKEPALSPNSVNGYRVAVARCRESFSGVPVDEITQAAIYSFLKRFADRGFSQKVITNTRSVLKGILDIAIIKGWLSFNPCVGLPPVVGKPKAKRKPAALTAQAAIDNSRYASNIGALLYTILHTGLRRGEAAGLAWENVDFENGLIYVTQSCAWTSAGNPVIKKPKTEAGLRTVVMISSVADVLDRLPRSGEYVFFDELPRRGKFDRQLSTFCKQHNIDSTLHPLRHAFATNGHEAGIDAKDMQAQLGHSTIAMTLDVYTAPDKSQLTRVRDSLEAFCQQSCQNSKKFEN